LKGVFLDFDTVCHEGDVSPAALERSLSSLDVFGGTPAGQVPERVADAEVLLTNKVHVSEEVMRAAPALKLICLAATGYDNVDVDAARRHRIGVTNITAYCTSSVVQHVFALMLALNQHLDEYRARMRGGDWARSPHFTMLDYPVRELTGRTMGIVGYGTLGRAVAHAAEEAFDMEVLIAARPGTAAKGERIALAELLPQVDVLSLHCPLNEHTRHLIGKSELEAMRPDALLINTARGAVVDEQALADALRAGEIGGAGIDVLSQEPPRDGNPLLDPDIPNLILTPHIAWAAVEARQRALDEMAANVAAFARGERRNRVD
jgi:glycerate dehydrogenase